MKSKKQNHLLQKIFLVSCLSLFLLSPCLAKEKIAPPSLSKNLTEYHYTLEKYENKLGYGDNEYLVLYGNEKSWLYDMNGKLYQTWNSDVKRARLLENCNLMIIDNNKNEDIREINFAGEPVWKYSSPGYVHHDFEITDNGDITFLYTTDLPETFVLENDCKHEEVLADGILQINKISTKKSFEWLFHENYPKLLNKDKCNAARRTHMAESNYTKKLDWAHPNAVNVIGENKWYKKGYEAFKPGNIMVTVHHFNRIIIIDKDTKKVVWLYEGDSNYNLEGPHEAKMIPKGYPGAGNILIFDNGLKRKFTRVIELNPINKKTVWSYSKPGEFYSKWAGSQQRLKNGDTFISDDVSGRVFIVNKRGKIKWQFTKDRNPWVKRASIYPKKDFAHCLTEKSK